MADDLTSLVRATYETSVLTLRDTTLALERAVRIVLGRWSHLSCEQARREVATMLADNATALSRSVA